MRTFGWTPDFVRKGITGAEGWIYYNWAMENEASIWGSGLDRRTPGYVKQEFEQLRAQRK